MPEAKQPFLFIVCQRGYESACKQELALEHPALKFAFSRPGLLTYKMADVQMQPLRSTFARTYGNSIAMLRTGDDSELLPAIRQHADQIPGFASCQNCHVWDRQCQDVGKGPKFHDAFRSGPTLVHTKEMLAAEFSWAINRLARPDELLVDLVRLDDNNWLLGAHTARSVAQRWPAGVPDLVPPDDMVSRAYLKTREALLWSRLPLRAGQVCVELGAAPGGSAQALLETGCRVIAIDPAELDEKLRANPNLVHLRKRAREVRKMDLRQGSWLLADMNVAGNYTLDAVEELATHPKLNFLAVLLTIKLMEQPNLESLSAARERVQQWGFEIVKSRQLAFNRNEICLFAARNSAVLRQR